MPEDINNQVVTETNTTPQQQSRAQVYQQYYGSDGNTPVVDPTPVVEDKVTPPPAVDLTPVTSYMQKLEAELEVLKSAVLPKPEAPKPLTPWFDQLRQGQWEEAEKDLTNRIRQQVSGETQQRAVEEAVERMRIEMAVDAYKNEVFTKFPEIAPMERYLRAPVEARMQAAVTAKKINNSGDFIREYKSAVDDEINELRKISQQYRAAGSEQARVRTQEVLSATPLVPQQVQQQNPNQDQTPQPENTNDYFSRRAAQAAKLRGL